MLDFAPRPGEPTKILQVRLSCRLDDAATKLAKRNNTTKSAIVRDCLVNLCKDEQRFEETYGAAIPLPNEEPNV
jgi:hypothetical protein